MTLKEFKLSNGLPVFLVKEKHLKTATILMMFKTGSKYEDRGSSGLSHFLEHLFFKGTEKRPNTLVLSSELDSIGAEFNAFTSKEYTGYYIKAPHNKLNTAIDVLSDMLINSKFEDEEIEREKGVIIEEMNMYEDNPMMQIEDVLESCLYGDSPAGWDVIGFKENILRFKRDDFIKYFDSQYGTRSAGLFIAGNFSEKNLKQNLEKSFAQLKKNKYQKKVKVVEKQKYPALKIKKKKTDQVALALGFRAFPSNHKSEFALRLLSVILGGSMSSRLFIELRERRGLAYYISSGTEFYTDSGYLAVRAGVPQEKLEESVKVILEECEKLKNELVSPKELKKAKDLLAGRLSLNLERSDSYSSWYGQQFHLRSNFLSPSEALKKYKEVSASDIKRVASKIFTNQGLNLAIIGNIKDESKIKKLLKIK